MAFARLKFLPQKATYWAGQVPDGYGSSSWSTPVVLNVRWEDLTDEKLSAAYQVEGELVVSRSMVWTEQALKEGGYLFLGETVEPDPTSLDKAFVIRSVAVIPSLRGGSFENVAYL